MQAGRRLAGESYVVQDGAVTQSATTDLVMRKSLAGGVVGAVQNVDWTRVVLLAALAAVVTHPGAVAELVGAVGDAGRDVSSEEMDLFMQWALILDAVR